MMTVPADVDIPLRLTALERRVAGQRIAIALFLVVGVLLGVMLSGRMPEASAQTRSVGDLLTVRGLVVVDERGVERVRIGAPLPDPIVEGKRGPRQGVVSGILIFDADGDERGGYVTSDTRGDAFLSLDAKKGQQTIFVANRDGGANLSVWSGSDRNKNYVSIRAVPTPLIEVVHDGKAVFKAGGPDTFSK